jgi:hypothetical protein
MADVIPIQRHKDYQRQAQRSVSGCLKQCRGMGLVEVLVIGVDGAGQVHVKSPNANPGDAFWLMEMARNKLVNP